MSEKEDFAQRIANYTPVQPKDVAYQAEVDKVEKDIPLLKQYII